jgi:hypothetical protein
VDYHVLLVQVVQTEQVELQQLQMVLQEYLGLQEPLVQTVLQVHLLLRQVRQVCLKLRVQTVQMVQAVLPLQLQE